jgi:hypothetical protein
MLGTALTESNLNALKQYGGGGALSWFQIEKETYYDVIRYLGTNRELKDAVLSACYLETFPNFESLTWNIRLALYVARVKYWMQPEPLPAHDDAEGLCNYYLKYYNTCLGKATFERSIGFFKHA